MRSRWAKIPNNYWNIIIWSCSRIKPEARPTLPIWKFWKRAVRVQQKIALEIRLLFQHIHRTPDGILSIADNISPIKRWEEAASALARDHRAVFDEINDAIFIHDVNDGRIVDVNQAACDMFEYTREELLNLAMGDLSAQSPPYNSNDFARWIMMPAILRNPRLEWKGRDRTGRTFWIQVRSKRMTIGGETRQVAVVQDITRRMHAEKELAGSGRSLSGSFRKPRRLHLCT